MAVAALAGAAVVSAYASIKAGQAAKDVADANATTAGAQGDVAATTGEVNARTILAQGEFNASEVVRRAEFNATQIDRQVGDVRASLASALVQQKTRGEFALGDIRAKAGASGVTMEGSPLEVLAFQAGQNEIERMTLWTSGRAQILDLMAQGEAQRTTGAADATAIRYDAASRALTARATGQVQAAGYRSNIGVYQAQGSAALSAGYTGAATSILGAAAKAAGK